MMQADRGRGAAAWTHAVVLLCLLGLLTYLFNESKDAGRQSRRHLQEGLRTLQIHDAQLSRDVLMARAGRLANYDPLMQDRQRLLEDLEALAQAGMRGLPEAAGEVVADRLSLDRAVREQLADVEHFKSENALTRNSLLYLTRAAAVLDADTEMRKLGALPSAHVQQALLRFVETLDTDAGAQIKAELDALAGGAPQGSPPLLVAHGRLIVDVLPGVDALLQRIVGAPTTARARDFEAALQRYDNQAEGRAQVLRYALYFFCLLLFGYLVHQFVRRPRACAPAMPACSSRWPNARRPRSTCATARSATARSRSSPTRPSSRWTARAASSPGTSARRRSSATRGPR